MSETTVNFSTPENILDEESEYVLKKKFCFASIPSLVLTVSYAVIIAFCGLVMFLRILTKDEFSGEKETLLTSLLPFVSMLLLCFFSFAKIDKPILSIPFVLLLINCFRLFWTTNIGEDTIAFAVSAVPYIVTAVYLIFATKKRENNIIKKIKFVPALTSLLGIIVYFVHIFYGVSELSEIFGLILSVLFFLFDDIINAVIIAFVCEWISNPYKKVLKKEKLNASEENKKMENNTYEVQATTAPVEIKQDVVNSKELDEKQKKYSKYVNIFNGMTIPLVIGVAISHIIICTIGVAIINDDIFFLGTLLGLLTFPLAVFFPFVIFKLIVEVCRNIAAIRINTEK